MGTVVVRLPDDLRGALKEPFGPVYTDADALLAEVSGRLITVGDVVTYHVLEAGRVPDVAVVDERTERSPVDPAILAVLDEDEADVAVVNPAATVTAELVWELMTAIRGAAPVRIRVDGEEDLAALPAIAGAPDGVSVVYGQPGAGMVHVRVCGRVRERVRRVIRRMDGDPDRLLGMLADVNGEP